MTALKMDSPPAEPADGIIDRPTASERRERRSKIAYSLLKRSGTVIRDQICKHRLGIPEVCGPVVFSKGFIDTRGSVLLSLDIPWDSVVVGGLTKSQRVAVDTAIFLILWDSAFTFDRGEFVEIPASRFNDVGGRKMTWALALLQCAGLVETDGSWSAGNLASHPERKALGYRLTELAESYPLTIRPMRLADAEKVSKRDRSELRKAARMPVHRRAIADLKRHSLDPRVWEVLRTPPAGQSLSKTVAHMLAAVRVARKDWFYSVSPKVGRCFTNISNFPRHLRPYLLIDGEPTRECDLKSSQPAFLIAEAVKHLPAGDPVRLALIDLVTQQDFYRVVVNVWAGMAIADRNAQKEEFYRIAFGRLDDTVKSPLWPSLLANAPLVAAYILAAKAPGYRELSWKLQRPEVEVIVHGTLSKLQAQGLPASTIHDGILVRERDAEMTCQQIKAAFFAYCGFEPVVAVKAAQPVASSDRITETIMHDVSVCETVDNLPICNLRENASISYETEAPISATLASRPVVPPAPAPTPCPADLCPDCWAVNRAIMLHSAFGCAHRQPRVLYCERAG